MTVFSRYTPDRNQWAFDKVASHLIVQNKESKDDITGEFLYRSRSGLKCAIGALIPDYLYSSKMERTNFFEEQFSETRLLVFRGVSARLLHDLQGIHDKNKPEDWLSLLTALANKWQLNYKALDVSDVPIVIGIEVL